MSQHLRNWRHPRHFLHPAGERVSASRSVAPFGSFTIDIDGQIVRLHDGITPGGFAKLRFFAFGVGADGTGRVANDGSDGGGIVAFEFSDGSIESLPIRTANVPYSGISLDIQHNRGHFPLVQLIDDSGEVVEARFLHQDQNNLRVETDVPVTGLVVIN